jgi:CHAT domain-containing protein
MPEEERRQAGLAQAAALREAQAGFDTVVSEIRAAGDPANFLRETLDMATVWRAAACGPAGHSLIYLLATPWGGLALGALGANRSRKDGRVAVLALPGLTSDLVSDLIQAEMDDLSGKVIGGFGHAQEGRGFSFIDHGWPGATFAEKAANLHAACAAARRESTLDRAAQEILAYPVVAALATRPLGPSEYAQLDPTFEFAYLRHELRRCLPRLAEVALRPLVAWLRQEGTASATFIPTGALATFPLLAVPLGEVRDPADASGWETVGDALAATVAPSARALLPAETTGEGANKRAGIATLGDPRPTHQALQWGEAEALTLAKIGGDARRARLHEQATREWLVQILGAAQVVDACCHGEFDPVDFLRSRLLLANGETLTLGEMLGGATRMAGLRLLILSACQTAILDLRGARDEVRSLAAGMLQAGARSVLGAQWSVDDKATYLLMARFAQEWFPKRERESPAAALARAKRWLRGVTNRELQAWERGIRSAAPSSSDAPPDGQLAVRGSGLRYGAVEAAERVSAGAAVQSPDARPFADPIFWSAFQITGW